jgi:ATP-dependent DNA helicase RecQ
MNPTVQHILEKHFGFSQLKPQQKPVVEAVLAGKNVLVILPTGTGKSLCYQLPALVLPGCTVVVSPLIALMQDQVHTLCSRGIAATCINSTLSRDEQHRRLTRLREGKIKLLYVAPERFQQPSLMNVLSQLHVSLLAVDEAHCISLWGHDFRPDYLRLGHLTHKLAQPVVMALTATAPPVVQDDILNKLSIPNARRIVSGFDRPNLCYHVIRCHGERQKISWIVACLRTHPHDSTLIYVATRTAAVDLAVSLSHALERSVLYYHAGLPDAQRAQIQKQFMQSPHAILVATNAFGMGVDKPDIRRIIHYHLPGTVEAYYQEAGRAGRDGDASECFLIYDPADKTIQDVFIRSASLSLSKLLKLQHLQTDPNTLDSLQHSLSITLRQVETAQILFKAWSFEHGNHKVFPNKLETIRLWRRMIKRRRYRYKQLEQMIRCAESKGCRRAVLMRYFDSHENIRQQPCCDICIQNRESEASQNIDLSNSGELWQRSLCVAILYCVARWPRRFTPDKLSALLSGIRTASVTLYDGFKVPVFGYFSFIPMAHIRSRLYRMQENGFVYSSTRQPFQTLYLTQKGSRVLNHLVR